AVLGAHEVGGEHLVGVVATDEVREWRLVAQAGKVVARESGDAFRLSTQFPRIGGKARRGEDHDATREVALGGAYGDVVDVWTHRGGEVAGQRPWGGGPNQQVRTRELAWGIYQGQQDGQGGV